MSSNTQSAALGSRSKIVSKLRNVRIDGWLARSGDEGARTQVGDRQLTPLASMVVWCAMPTQIEIAAEVELR